MKAVVLVGGFGTRLRPLTETVKKELLPLVDRPALDHTLDRLVRHGVHEVVMSSPYLEAGVPSVHRRRVGANRAITWITEHEPLGTGGAIVHALDALGRRPVLRAERRHPAPTSTCRAMLASHRLDAAEVTIALHHVDDARAFGLVDTDAGGRVTAFREKPADARAG